MVAVWSGPPTLPPLPGQRQPPPKTAPAAPEATQPTVAKPATVKPATVKPATVKPATATPIASPPTTAAPSGPAPMGPVAAPEGPGDIVEPPQPPAAGPPLPEPSANPPAPVGPGLAPTMDSPGAAPAQEADGPPQRWRLPPPKRPPYSGTGLFIGAGVTFAIALTEQIVAHVLVRRRCIDPFADELAMTEDEDPVVIDPMDPPERIDPTGGAGEDIGEITAKCAPGVIPALALRVHSDIGLLAMVGLASAGGSMRGRTQAWDAVFGDKPYKDSARGRIAGISLIGTGVVTWFSTGAASWGWMASCKDARCVRSARILNFTMRDASALMVASGAAMLAFSETRRRATSGFERDRALSFGMSRIPGGGLLGLSGRI